jgi:hypothetical protein
MSSIEFKEPKTQHITAISGTTFDGKASEKDVKKEEVKEEVKKAENAADLANAAKAACYGVISYEKATWER